jgi:DNA-binding SARP family transcriptional activator
MGGDSKVRGLAVGLLGSVEIGRAGGVTAPLVQPRQRVLLGLLAVAARRLVTAEALIEGL